MPGGRYPGLAVELLAAIDRILVRRLGDDDPVPRPAALPPAHPPIADDAGSKARLGRAIYRARRDRDVMFDGHGRLFGEPAWDILLDLYIAYHEKSAVSVSSVCIAAAVPATTGLRHLGSPRRSRPDHARL